MKKDDFYLGLNIINILLVVYIIGMFVLFFMTMFTNNAAASWFIVLYVILKILLLPLFFEVIEKFFPKSIFSNVAEELKTNKCSRKSAIILSFCYDVGIILLLMFFEPTISNVGIVYMPMFWEVATLGGICTFYLAVMLYWYIAKRLKRQTLRLKINPKAAGFWVNFIKPVLIILPAILFITSFMNNFPIDKIYEQPAEYNRAIRSIHDKTKIEHFPKKIPQSAKNIKLYKVSNSFFGSEEIALRFNIDKDYIKKEIDSHRYISVKEPLKPDEQDEDYYVHGIIGNVLNNSSYGINPYKLYIIGTKPEDKAGFPMEYGIAVDYKNNDIVYYYAVVD